jgi:hypothetical protein
MTKQNSSSGLDLLLDLDGTTLVIDPHGRHWVKFSVRRVPPSLERPHGLSYSLTLHSSDGQRLMGFDNAHSVTERRGLARATRIEHDHKHKNNTIKHYEYSDSETLLADFWAEVDRELKRRGITP